MFFLNYEKISRKSSNVDEKFFLFIGKIFVKTKIWPKKQKSFVKKNYFSEKRKSSWKLICQKNILWFGKFYNSYFDLCGRLDLVTQEWKES